MAKITLHGNAINTGGDLPAVGTKAPDFELTKGDLSDVKLAEFSGRKKVLNIVPSLDTGVCAASARKFNSEASGMDNTVVLIISADLPFAQSRFCEAEGLKDVIPLSTLRSSFAADYGIELVDGPLKGLTGRAVVVLDENDQVVYTELVPEIAQEPDYAKALSVL